MTKKIFQWLGLLLAWLTISPVFFLLSRRWKLLPKVARWALMLVSPMFVAFYLIVYLAIMSYNPVGGRTTDQFKDRAALSEATSVEFPEFKVVAQQPGEVSFTGDYSDIIEAEFLAEPDSTFYKSIEKQSEADMGEGGFWLIGEDGYHFSLTRDGYKAPNGQNDDDDVFMTVMIPQGGKTFTIQCGKW